MRALVVEAPGRCAVRVVPRPRARAGEVVARVVAAGICGSDVEVLAGTRPAPYVRYPLVPGHEWVGVIDEVGTGVHALGVGTTVVAGGIRSVCARCSEDRGHLCVAGYAETGFTEPGGLAEFVAVPAALVHAVLTPGAYPLATAALLEPAACVATGLLELGGVPARAAVAVVGDGALGQLALLLARASKPARLQMFGLGPERLALAEALGATTSLVDDPADAASDGSFDLVVEASGSADGAARALRLARRGGAVVLAGISGDKTATIDPDRISTGHLRIQGVFGSSRRAWCWVTDMWSAGGLDCSALVTHRFPLARADEALACAGDRSALKILVLPELEGA